MVGYATSGALIRALAFRVARNTDPESRLLYLIWHPIEGGLALEPIIPNSHKAPRCKGHSMADVIFEPDTFPRRGVLV